MTVVVGYAPTDEGRAALARAVAEARLRGAVLRVVDTGREATVTPEGLRPLLDGSGVEHELVERRASADAAEDVISAAEGAQLVVIGLRRRTAVGKLILGSGATRILLEAPCPVLTAKPGA